ncbi:hypothetical protein FXW78_25220 [Rhodococcus opacus]|nr:hypothetical protein [Rhodococcus opacus]
MKALLLFADPAAACERGPGVREGGGDDAAVVAAGEDDHVLGVEQSLCGCQPEVHWDTVVLHQYQPRSSHWVHAVGSTLGMVTAVGAIAAAVTALTLVVGGLGAALLHVVWGTADPARSEKVVGDFLDVVPEAGTTLLVALLLTGGAIGGLHLVNRQVRKHQPARITGARLEQAPDDWRQPMSDAVLAVEQIKGSRAFRDGMFTDLDLRAAMWDLGTRVLAAT